MSYGYSDIERENLKWFDKDMTRQSLKGISITKGQIRGLGKFDIRFTYPISAIAGKNGSGKSSILALAACAFHNKTTGWRLPDRRFSYYTFSDFFIQAAEDVPVGGISINYHIAHNNWKPTPSTPGGVGEAYQTRAKNHGGKWNDYDKRVPRCVAFLGIERVVPPAERSVYKSYRYSFSSSARSGWEESVRQSASRVLGVSYEDFEVKSHGKYRLPLVKRKGGRYSGFNMGAGEKAIFEVFAAIFASPVGSLILIDELELGLHEVAQRRLVKELTRICYERKVQVICTTHSPVILASLPPEGRFLIQQGKHTQVLSGITPAYAAGRLGEFNSGELVIYVEDKVASALLESVLDMALLNRIKIVPVGSHSTVVHQMAARYIEDPGANCLAVLDGDQSIAFSAHLKRFTGYVGAAKSDRAEQWVAGRLLLLPGDAPPESWVFSELSKLKDDDLSKGFVGADSAMLREAIDNALLAEAHDQIFEFSKLTGVDINYVWRDCCRLLSQCVPGLLNDLALAVRKALDE